MLEIVAEKTGYPKDMLDLDLDLEADLGVDTVKQAEMFAAVRAAYNIPRDENIKLRDFPTLAHVIKLCHEQQARLAAPTASPPIAEAACTRAAGRRKNRHSQTPFAVRTARPRPALASFDAANRIPRRVPVPDPAPGAKRFVSQRELRWVPALA